MTYLRFTFVTVISAYNHGCAVHQVLLAAGKRVLDKEPKIGAHGNPVVFLHPKDFGGVLVELEEVKGSGAASPKTL